MSRDAGIIRLANWGGVKPPRAPTAERGSQDLAANPPGCAGGESSSGFPEPPV